jgi:hypothetical protein
MPHFKLMEFPLESMHYRTLAGRAGGARAAPAASTAGSISSGRDKPFCSFLSSFCLKNYANCTDQRIPAAPLGRFRFHA